MTAYGGATYAPQMTLRHNRGYIIVIVATLMLHVASLVIYFWETIKTNETITADYTPEPAFPISSGVPTNHNPDDPLPTRITVITKVFLNSILVNQAMWPIMFAWQTMWLIYAVSTMCRRIPSWSSYLYVKPRYLPIATYVLYMIAMILLIVWSTMKSMELPDALADMPILFIAVFLMVALVIAHKSLYNEGGELLRMNLKRDVALTRGLLHNGLAFFTTMIIMDAMSYLGNLMLLYHVPIKDCNSTIMGLVGLLVLIYSVTDSLVLDRFTRFTITPYLVLIIVLTVRIFEGDLVIRNIVILSLVVCMSFVGLLMKIIFIVSRKRNPEPIREKPQTNSHQGQGPIPSQFGVTNNSTMPPPTSPAYYIANNNDQNGQVILWQY